MAKNAPPQKGSALPANRCVAPPHGSVITLPLRRRALRLSRYCASQDDEIWRVWVPNALFTLAFAVPPPQKGLDVAPKYTRWLVLQKARRHPDLRQGSDSL